MSRTNIWYTIEKNQNGYTIWKNKESQDTDRGGYGSLGLFTSQFKKDCIDYCKKHKIKYETQKHQLHLFVNPFI